MSPRNKLSITLPSDVEIAMTRAFDAPRALVWEMFTTAEHVKQWWGHGCQENLSIELDARVGGRYRFVGRTPDGNVVPFTGEFRELLPPERIVYTETFDVDGAREHPALITATFSESNGKTTVHIVARYDSKQTRDMVLQSGMETGAGASYDEVERMLAELSELTIEREFAAPRELVWAAWTEPTQFAKWFGPRGFTVPRVELDVRPGGAVRYDMRGPNGMTMTAVGAFTEVVTPERLAYTERAEAGGQVMFEMLNTITLVERGTSTLLTLHVRVLRAQPGMWGNIKRAGGGWTQAFDKLGELLAR